jgi:hypothetical protein
MRRCLSLDSFSVDEYSARLLHASSPTARDRPKHGAALNTNSALAYGSEVADKFLRHLDCLHCTIHRSMLKDGNEPHTTRVKFPEE